MKNTHIMAGVIFILLFLLCLLAGIIVIGDGDSGNEMPSSNESVKNTLDLSDPTITEWNNIQRVSNNTDFQDFQGYIDSYNTTYELRNYENGIISLDDFLGPIVSFIDDNPTGAGEISVYKEYYKLYFDFVNDSGEITGETEYKCYSPGECYNVTLFMAGNPELEQIFGGDCIPVYDEFEYFCYLNCSYDSGEEAYFVFHNHQVVFYYQDEEIMESFDQWFDGIPEYH
ncbi:hypothetical protein Mpet_0437 [Methanolacinia petrolearia DSM 11571]|uniref:Uncharacterized protein n=1 Tax=Methanolacinia petrolearia (strain DSM 11571 / OCM 486 / SEBR 4847) TaxID=679926 RepID=E1RGK0_METP4|nr:hypothetical protein [Methanolacinia petrolearia]ADN35211.1 hypothetical protein Mpet_0437 [Methanolacinia petrolearia DSM 11571]